MYYIRALIMYTDPRADSGGATAAGRHEHQCRLQSGLLETAEENESEEEHSQSLLGRVVLLQSARICRRVVRRND